MDTERGYSKEKEPDLFYERCKSLYQRDRGHIETARNALLEKDVPEKYIFVCQTNRSNKEGDIFPYDDNERVEGQLNFIRDFSPRAIVQPEGAYRFTCVDLRDRTSILEICTFPYIEKILDEGLADIETRTLEFDKQKDYQGFRNQRWLNRTKARNMVSIQYAKLKKQTGSPDEHIFVAHTKRNDPLKKGELISYSDKERLFETIATIDEGASVCHYPPDDIFTCLDICNLPELRKYISVEAISDDEITQIVCNIKQLSMKKGQ
jgi:hypothetical protein